MSPNLNESHISFINFICVQFQLDIISHPVKLHSPMTTVMTLLFFSDFFFIEDFFSDGGIAFNTIPDSSSKIESKSATASSALRLKLSSSAAVLSQWNCKATMLFYLKRKTFWSVKWPRWGMFWTWNKIHFFVFSICMLLKLPVGVSTLKKRKF